MAETLLLNDRYRLLAKIGEGGMAEVYKAQDALLGRVVAVKVLRQQYSSDEAFLARFQREAQAAANLTHPNIVGVYDIGREDDRHYLVMEYVEGRSLKELLIESTPLPVWRALDIAIQICAGVAHAHEAGIVHRDVKPGNVLVTVNDQVKVTDFGIAKALSSASATETGVVLGTAHYLSPEQAAGEMATPASDVYALGVVLYEMLTGEVPFQAESSVGVALKHIQEEPIPIHVLNPRVSLQLETIVSQAMAKEPSARYPTAKEFGQALQDYRRLGEEITAPHPLVRVRKPVEERGRDWLGLLLGVLALLAVLGLIPLWTLVYQRYHSSSALTLVPQARVPSLVGLEGQEAKRLVEEAGLKFQIVEERYDDTAPPLRVISQTVPSGEMVKRGETIGVVLSKGPSFAYVPAVIAEDVALAEAKLTEAGLAVEKSDQWSEKPAGTVIAQEPSAGTVVPKGATVRLVVSTGSRLMLEVNLDDKVLLSSCDLEDIAFKPGDTMRLTLHWLALRTMEEDYTVFVHLARGDGTILTQRDSQPLQGTRPTSSWTKGESVDDPYELTVPSDASPGTYWLKVGMYSFFTSKRLPVVHPGKAQVTEDSVLVKQVRVLSP